MSKRERVYIGYNGVLYQDTLLEQMRELETQRREFREKLEETEMEIAELREILERVRAAVE